MKRANLFKLFPVIVFGLLYSSILAQFRIISETLWTSRTIRPDFTTLFAGAEEK